MQNTSFWNYGVAALALTVACGASERHAPPDDGKAAAAGTDDMGRGGSGGSGAEGGGVNRGGTGGALSIGGSSTRGGASTGGAMGGSTTRGGASGQGGGVSAGQSTGGAGAGGVAATNGGGAGAGSGAKPNGGGMAGAAEEETLTSCATWTVERGEDSTSTAELVEGGLLLKLPGGSWSKLGGPFNSADIGLSQSGLTGDFDVVVSFDQFQPGDEMVFAGPRFEAGVWYHADSGEITQSNGTVGQEMATVSTAVWPVPHMGTGATESVNHLIPDDMWLIDASGTIELRREGTSITATITVNGESVSYTSPEVFDVDPLVLFLSLGNTDEERAAADSSVRITSVMVEGQGVMSDTFDCVQ